MQSTSLLKAAPAQITLHVGGKTPGALIVAGKYTVHRGSVQLLAAKGLIRNSTARVVEVERVPYMDMAYTVDIERHFAEQGLEPLDAEEMLTFGTLGYRLSPGLCYFSPQAVALELTDRELGIQFRKYGAITIATAPNGDTHLCMPDWCKAGGSGWRGVALGKRTS